MSDDECVGVWEAVRGSWWRQVGRTFDKVVYDERKDVVVFFHAPWCKHCKEMDAPFSEVSAHRCAVCEMDAETQTDVVPRMRRWPSIFWCSADG